MNSKSREARLIVMSAGATIGRLQRHAMERDAKFGEVIQDD
jgi:hypothetical protein